ncbi:two-component system response regulator RegX3 [Thermomonospora umbrina]|uniref:Sensory transduction protein RegX3 n=2 Tax=Thermomonospora umbrina TaxID=111806 RepID=A0A3D9SM93_9ACTN|nr:two-component system response regulator RegX3 [Thermomonospora umbrina]
MVVEDDPSVVRLLSSLLEDDGYQPVVADTGPEALELLDSVGAELVLLDLTLAGPWSGNEVLRRLRTTSDIPVIIVSGKAGEVDRIVGLEMGADDYVTKPFSPRELMARVRAVLRRRPIGGGDDRDGVVAAGPVRMDVDRHLVTVHGHSLDLPLKEFQLLEVLVRNAELVLSRTRLIEAVWGPEYYGDTKTLDVHVKRLRTKIEPDRHRPRHIVNVRGIGYKFTIR